ncbi:MAG: DUF3152 domain-containing protein [Candidatus Saccharimonadales bacterium]
MKNRFAATLALLIATGLYVYSASAMEDTPSYNCQDAKSIWCLAPRADSSLSGLREATVPKLATPDWFEPVASVTRTVTYTVATKGAITASMDEFRAVVAATLNDPRGWSRLGVAFQRVESGGDFTVVLAEASQMPGYNAVCDTYTSCSIGRNVVINQDRWVGAATAWNQAGGGLEGYRQYVINHEVGHWLGHGHRTCEAAGQPSPLMQQQTLDLHGCTPNPWPLGGEMYSPSLGIRS